MKSLIKQNLRIVTIVSITTVISVIMIYMIIDTNEKREVAIQNLDQLKSRIQRLNYSKPSPSKENIKKVESEISAVNEENSILKGYFGAVYSKAISFFIYKLHTFNLARIEREKNELEQKYKNNKISQEDYTGLVSSVDKNIKSLEHLSKIEQKHIFFKKWINFLKKQKGKDEAISPMDLLESYRNENKFTKKQFNSAILTFKNKFQKDTVEIVNESNFSDYLMAALGVPLEFTRVRCKNFAISIQTILEKKLHAAKILQVSEQLKLFNEFTTVPNDDQIPFIIHYCRFYEDLFLRMIKSKIDTLVSYKKLNGLQGTTANGFLVFKYEVEFVSSLSSARDFFNSLQNAYTDNRIYIIKSMKLKKILDNADNLEPYKEGLSSDKITILLGSSDLVRSSIILEYVIYNQPLIKI